MPTLPIRYPSTPSHNAESGKELAPASMALSTGRLAPVGEERSPPKLSVVDNSDNLSLSPNMLRSVDRLLNQDGAYHLRTAPSIIPTTVSAKHHLADDSSMPSLVDDSSTVAVDSSRSFDNDHEDGGLDVYQAYAFSPIRTDQRRSKPQSSPGAKETSSFFQDLAGPRVSPLAPFESTPRKVETLAGTPLYPNTLPRAQFHRRISPSGGARKDRDSSPEPQSPTHSSNSPVRRISSPQITDSHQPDLQQRLSASQSDNAQLQERCETMSQEIADLKDALQQMTYPHAQHYLHLGLPANDSAATNPVWGPRSPAFSGSRNLCPRTNSPSGGWSGRHSPAMSDVKSCEGSPSINYIGLSLINSIQAQLQAGMDGQSPSSEADRRAQAAVFPTGAACPPTACSSPSRDGVSASSPNMNAHANIMSCIRPNLGSLVSKTPDSPRRPTPRATSPLAVPHLGLNLPTTTTVAFPQGPQPPWLTPTVGHGTISQSRHAQSGLGCGGEGLLPEAVGLHHDALGSLQQVQPYTHYPLSQAVPALHIKPRHSAPALAMPYISSSFFSGEGSAATGANSFTHSAGGVSAGRIRGVDAYTPPEVLVARALSGRSQEASIILQQQLKSGPADRQAAVIRAITPHLLSLSEDKHGNFLVQRAIGVNPSVAWKLKGSYARLALSQYGCHVVQRILDEPEPLKIAIVEELLSQNLLDTLTSRNSVHVWAKALEIKWSSDEFRNKVFQIINSAMRGHWAYTAMQETGSIVVQNLFESAQDHEKRDCIGEILERLPDCAANQWGVWVVQHIIEHGDDESRRVSFQKLLSEAATLSMSQFGQKAIMTALKSRDAAFINGYLDLLCDGASGSGSGGEGSSQSNSAGSSSSGRRSVLVDIASTPQGLQIMTQLLTTIGREDRERIIKAVRRNSVFLKGTKTGLKVHQMCERARAFTGY